MVGKRGAYRKTHIKPVIKQYADSGAVAFSPSISVKRYFFKLVSVVESLRSRSCFSDMEELDRKVDGKT
jgi:hypothetical protein